MCTNNIPMEDARGIRKPKVACSRTFSTKSAHLNPARRSHRLQGCSRWPKDLSAMALPRWSKVKGVNGNVLSRACLVLSECNSFSRDSLWGKAFLGLFRLNVCLLSADSAEANLIRAPVDVLVSIEQDYFAGTTSRKYKLNTNVSVRQMLTYLSPNWFMRHARASPHMCRQRHVQAISMQTCKLAWNLRTCQRMYSSHNNLFEHYYIYVHKCSGVCSVDSNAAQWLLVCSCL